MGAASPFSPSTMGPGLDTASCRSRERGQQAMRPVCRPGLAPSRRPNRVVLRRPASIELPRSTNEAQLELPSKLANKHGLALIGSLTSESIDPYVLRRRRPTVATSPYPPAIQRCDACGDVAMFALMKEKTAGRSTIPRCGSHWVHPWLVGRHGLCQVQRSARCTGRHCSYWDKTR